ncbi:MAG: LysM peptidoglycan-binding domain-containing protein [Lachnospiraceae bacterium]|nr:LysM peptidoglycan-binding domain-containing protein [Lachnospiraceae bacterium]
MKQHAIFKNMLVFIIPVVLFFLCFFLFKAPRVSADSGDLNTMKNYESVLIREGDTLTSLSEQYAGDRSHFSSQEYMTAIISLNNLSSEYIEAGNYLLLPNYI